MTHYRQSITRVLLDVIALLLLFFHETAAQATCMTGFEWMYNSMGQSPCLVAGYLSVPCGFTNPNDIFPLANNKTFYAPTGGALECDCNTVAYSMLSACSLCQGAIVGSWTDYSSNCTNSSIVIGNYWEDLPVGTTVPAWAYLNVTVQNTFDVVAAQAFASRDHPDSTATSAPQTTTTSGNATITNTPLTAASNSTQTATGIAFETSPSHNLSKSARSGAIAGGVVGGVVVLSLLGLGLCYFARRRRRTAVTAASNPKHFDDGTSMAYSLQTESFLPPKIYNPDDPSTYPLSPVRYGGATEYSGASEHSRIPEYSGAPEV
ncbi:hypothetical protein A0H81_03608 [Grifola frondosa]|uniref:Transmembrane protein n=1 Tax=Grifola frondosa TaxID=5627 RepID=A0A1C7MHL2_GRIFR|nr:hypothetical protein A0H81_03608 [Grifola frondosa]